MSEPKEAEQDLEETTPISWVVLSSGRTLAVLLSLLGVLVCLGTYIPQHVGVDVLLRQFNYATARSLAALGLHDLTSAWPLQLLSMLIFLTGLGWWLRLRTTQTVDKPGQLGESTGLEDVQGRRQTLELAMTEVQQRMSKQGWAVRWTSEGGVARRGLFLQGLIMLVMATMVFIASLWVERLSGQRLRANVVAHAGLQVGQPGQTEIEVWESGQWIQRQLPFVMDCSETAIGLQDRGWNCDLRRRARPGAVDSTVDKETIQVGRRWPATAFGYDFFIVKEQPLPGSREPMVLVDIAKERPQPLVALSPGAQTPLQATKTTLTAFRGADGPLIVITPPEGRPFLAAPRRSATDKVARVEGKSLGFVPGWRVTFEATRRAGTYLMLSALILFLLGFGLCLLIPDVTVSLRSVEAGQRCQVEITSLNRSRSLNSILEGICGQQEGI